MCCKWRQTPKEVPWCPADDARYCQWTGLYTTQAYTIASGFAYETMYAYDYNMIVAVSKKSHDREKQRLSDNNKQCVGER